MGFKRSSCFLSSSRAACVGHVPCVRNWGARMGLGWFVVTTFHIPSSKGTPGLGQDQSLHIASLAATSPGYLPKHRPGPRFVYESAR